MGHEAAGRKTGNLPSVLALINKKRLIDVILRSAWEGWKERLSPVETRCLVEVGIEAGVARRAREMARTCCDGH
jgi:hypothetical protein